MTHRGPFQPLQFHNSVILSSAKKPCTGVEVTGNWWRGNVRWAKGRSVKPSYLFYLFYLWQCRWLSHGMGAGQTCSAGCCCAPNLPGLVAGALSEPEVLGFFNYQHVWRHRSNSKERWEEQLFSKVFMERSSHRQFLWGTAWRKHVFLTI